MSGFIIIQQHKDASVQQAISTTKKPVNSHVSIPGSKGISQRAILMAAIADGASEITNLHIDADIRALIDTLNQFGIVSQLDEMEKSCIIGGCNKHFPRQQTNVWCNTSSSNAIYLMSACATTSGVYYFDGAPSLHEYDISNLILLLKNQGVQFTPSDTESIPFTMIGCEGLEGGTIIVDQSVDGDQLSCLMIASPYAYSPFTFRLNGSANQTQLMITSAVMTEFGILIQQPSANEFHIPIVQSYVACDYHVEPDYGYASYFLAAAAVTGGTISMQKINRLTSKQPEIYFLNILEKMGCDITEQDSRLIVKGPAHLKGIKVNLHSFAETFTALAAIAPFASQPTEIHHAGVISIEELNRINALKSAFFNLGITVETGNNWIRIHPTNVYGGAVNISNDPFIGLALALVGIKVPGVVIDNAECINKIYPDFFTAWKKMVAETNINV